ncbi:MAG TPA: glycosyltransferase, partial [Paludibacter sp.]|nr:glycosyltransferase [Paludibacter sp.]
GLLSSGKSIETTLEALPAIIRECPDVVFLVLGRTHPVVVRNDGEIYRESLMARVKELKIENHVKFVNKYLGLPELLEYLQLTDIYVFTSKDPNQAVSGTFVYAMSCGCPIISTPIPHAKELLTADTGMIFDFGNSKQLAESVNSLLNNEKLLTKISINTLEKIASTSWENSAVAHTNLFYEVSNSQIYIRYNLPEINMGHLDEMTTDFALIQFSKLNQPDLESGYTLDDNARALVAMCEYLKIKGDKESLIGIRKYLNFIKSCQQRGGSFLNYVDKNRNFTDQNTKTDLGDSNGRALWALGHVVSMKNALPKPIVNDAIAIFDKAIANLKSINSPRSIGFAIKGIYGYQLGQRSMEYVDLVKVFAERLMKMYKQESSLMWEWFENSLTYANSILPEAMLYAYLITGEPIYKDIARNSFNFLLSNIYNGHGIEVVSNKSWLRKGEAPGEYGEQPIDVGYTIMTLSKFYEVFEDEDYFQKMVTAFNWFLGKNRLHQIIYNPCTGGCYDGLEAKGINLNQGAESTVSYLLARFTMEKYKNEY